jgi:hypothetical protein
MFDLVSFRLVVGLKTSEVAKRVGSTCNGIASEYVRMLSGIADSAISDVASAGIGGRGWRSLILGLGVSLGLDTEDWSPFRHGSSLAQVVLGSRRQYFKVKQRIIRISTILILEVIHRVVCCVERFCTIVWIK